LPVRVRCPTCKGLAQVEDKYLGATVRCPRCKEAFAAALAAPDSWSLASLPADLGGPAPAASPAVIDGRPPPPGPAIAFEREEKMRPLSLERVPWAWVDRIMPARPVPYLIAVASVAVGCWLMGLLLAGDKGGFLASHEWQVQPFFLATHFVCLRLFVTCYTRNFLAGAARMDLPEGEAVRRIKQVLGPYGGAAALVIALPFCISNFFYLHGEEFVEEAAEWGGEGLAPINLFLWLIWCAEWILNAYIWVLLLGFLYLTMRTLWQHRFRASIEVLLHEKHYRPFLMMSAQGASIVLFFGVVNAFYVWYSQGDIWDYVGLGITGTLLLVGFGPPWMQLKSNVERAVDKEMYQLQERMVKAMQKQAEAGGAAGVTVADLAERLDHALAVLRTMYLDRMHRELGRAEGKALLLKLLAPASTIGWKILRPMVMGG
jgi:hypothetical protein